MTHIADRLADLLRPEAFPHPATEVRLIETHISWVILAGKFAYKLRKPVKFGFLDFSTVEQRRTDCEAEVRLNQRLCSDLYLTVVEVSELEGRLRFDGEGSPVEPAVQMRRLPESGMLSVLVARGLADERLMRRIARQLANFHQAADTGPGVDEYGSLAMLRANWDENFAQATAVQPEVRSARKRMSIMSSPNRLTCLNDVFASSASAMGTATCTRGASAASAGNCICSTASNSARVSAAGMWLPRWRSSPWTLNILAVLT